MDPTLITNKMIEKSNEEVLVSEEEVENLKQCLPKANWMGCAEVQLIYIHHFWYPAARFANILTFQRNFIAQHSDIVVTSFPKTGTTWLKSLLFSVINRNHHPSKQSPLLTHNPHELVHDLETDIYGDNSILLRPKLHQLPSPRLLHSHMPYVSLPDSIKTCDNKIVYIARNPLDTLVSHWHFYPKTIKKIVKNEDFQPPDISDFFEEFCQGKVFYGPYFEHVIGYWKQSLERPNKVLFFKYEDLKEFPTFYVKKLAEFVGVPFTCVEENEGVIQQIIDLCSLNNLKKLEVNRRGLLNKYVHKHDFFREGEIGGWRNHLSASMFDRMKSLMEETFRDTGLSFKLLPE